MNRIAITCAAILLAGACGHQQGMIGETVVEKWPYERNGAVSLTYDDGTINQFRRAVPLMNQHGFPATFFINTGYIPGSQFRGNFIGRDVKDIIEETATVPTKEENFFERCAAAGFLGYKGTLEDGLRAGTSFDRGAVEAAWKILDELYKKVRSNGYPSMKEPHDAANIVEEISWDDLRAFAAEGHEFASHMVTHPRLAALDEPNILYELEKSREEILNQIGIRHTFSAEVPFGTENERAMEYAYRVYPALRNRMPEPFLEELNRGNRKDPGSSEKEYVQWQRGAVTSTHLPLMKSWVDTTASHDNIWLVLVFHGVDGIGWEALSGDTLDAYFRYIKSREDDLWVATFGNVARYLRERVHAKIRSEKRGRSILVDLTHPLDTVMYDIPLSLKTYIPSGWEEVRVTQHIPKKILPKRDSLGNYVIYQAVPNGGRIEISSN